jgi:hypothetical protein
MMGSVIQLDHDTCRQLYLSFDDDSSRRIEFESNVGIPVFDTSTSEVIQVCWHGPNSDLWCCQNPPYEERLLILTAIKRLDEMQELAEDEEWQIKAAPIDDPLRYVELEYHGTHRSWIEGSGWAQEENIREHVIDWLAQLGKQLGITYQFDPSWIHFS